MDIQLQNKPEEVSFQPVSRASRTRLIAATGLFAALSILLTTLSQALGLNFPILPYLQFDFGEVAILLAFFLFGPIPAVAASVVEFLTLMVVGENVPIGPVLKIVSILSSLGGLWLGMALAKKLSVKSKTGVLGSSFALGLVSRAVILTFANYYLIEFYGGAYSLAGIESFVAAPFKLIGVTISNSNALALVLGFTAVFNCLQLGLVFAISYLLVRMPQLSRAMRSNRLAWFETFATNRIQDKAGK